MRCFPLCHSSPCVVPPFNISPYSPLCCFPLCWFPLCCFPLSPHLSSSVSPRVFLQMVQVQQGLHNFPDKQCGHQEGLGLLTAKDTSDKISLCMFFKSRKWLLSGLLVCSFSKPECDDAFRDFLVKEGEILQGNFVQINVKQVVVIGFVHSILQGNILPKFLVSLSVLLGSLARLPAPSVCQCRQSARSFGHICQSASSGR
jgi:hypothetical protein